MKKLNSKMIASMALFSGTLAFAQVKVGDNPTTMHASAVLEVESTNKGLLIPRVALLNTTDNTTISGPATSLLVFNTATAGDIVPGFYYWDGARWKRVNSTSTTSTGTGAPTATSPASPSAGDIYVDETTGDIYTFNGTTWTNVTTTSSGAGAPTATSPASPIAGDIYVNNTNGDIYTYNGSTWENQSGVSADANNVLINGTDGLAYLSQAAIQGASGVSSGTGAPTATSPASPSAGDIYINETTGDVYTYNGTTWTNVTTTSSGAGAPTATSPASPIAGDIYVNNTNGDIYTYNGSTWENQSGVSADANNVLINGTDGLAYLSQAAIQGASGVSSGTGAPTATSPASPSAGDIYINETTGDVYTFNGTTWTNVTTTSSGSGAPTATSPASPIAGDIYVNNTNGDIYTYNGSTWENQSGVSADANNVLINGTDGLAYLSQAAIQGASGVSSGTGAPTATSPASPSAGDIYINETTGDVYTYNGTTWTNVTTTSSGAGAPTATSPASPIAGDIYVNNTNGDIYTYNGSTWENQSGVSADANNVLVNGTDGLAYLSQAAIQGASGVSSGTGAPTATSPASPSAGDIYINETTGDVYTYNGTTWTNVTTTSSGAGAPTATSPASPIAGDIYVNNTNGDIYTYNGSTWENQSGVSADANNVLINGTDGLAYLSQAAIQGASGVSSGTGAPTATSPASPSAGDIYVNETTGDVYTYNGTTWTNVTTTSSGSGAPTATSPASPIAGDIYVNNTNGDIYTYNGSTWENQSGVSADANNVLVNGTDGLAYLSQAAIQGASGVSSGTGAPTATSPASPSAGDIYINETTGDVYTFNGTTWTNQSADLIVGNEVVNGTTNGGLVRSGTGTEASPYTLGLTPGTAANQTMVWNGTAWVAGASGLVATALTSTTAPAGTAVGEMIYNTNAASGVPVGPTYWDGTTWQPIATQEPWKNAATGAAATDNTQNIYQMGNIGIGTNTPTSVLQVAGPIATPIVSVSSAVTLTNSHSVLKVNTTAGDITLTLPSASSANGRAYTIIKTDSSINKLIFSQTIYGGDYTFTEANVPGEYVIQSDGTNWNLIQ